MTLDGKQETNIPNRYDTQPEASAALAEGAHCRCGGTLKLHQISGAYWLLCMKHPAHRGVRVPTAWQCPICHTTHPSFVPFPDGTIEDDAVRLRLMDYYHLADTSCPRCGIPPSTSPLAHGGFPGVPQSIFDHLD